MAKTKDIFEATAKNRRASIARHLEEGANVDAVNEQGLTALHLAARHGRHSIAGDILGAGADVHRQDNNGRTALHVAAIEGKDDIIVQLLATGAKVDDVDNAGNTALHMAAGAYGPSRSSTAQLLISAGADLHRVNGVNYTAFGIAEDMGSPDMANLFKRFGGRRESIHVQV